MDFEDGFELINYAIKQNNEEKMYNTWLHGYNQSFSYEEFKDLNSAENEDFQDENLTVEEILTNVKNVLGGAQG